MLAKILAVIFAGALYGVPRYKTMFKILLGIWLILGLFAELRSCGG